MFLYKYCKFDEYIKKNLRDEVICYNSFSSFNDPFEGLGRVDMTPDPDEQVGNLIPDYFFKMMQGLYDGMTDEVSNDFSSKLNHNYRVTCFSKCYKNPSLWAHYADAHKGICIAYLEEDIRKLSYKLSRIIYDDNFPVFQQNTVEDFQKNIMKVIFSKSTAWEKEEEWRSVINNGDGIEIELPEYISKQDTDFTYYSSSVYRRSFKSLKRVFIHCKPQLIYLGCKISENDKLDLEQIHFEKGYVIRQMAPQKDRYEFDDFPYIIINK